MASLTARVVKGAKLGSKGCFLWRVRIILRVERLEVCLEREVNCLLKELEMCFGEVSTLGPKVMG